MAEKDSNPDVVCTIEPDHLKDRDPDVLAELRAKYVGAEERERGYTIKFDGVNDTVKIVAEFITNELRCCSFAEYELTVEPPFDHTRMTITGPEGTKTMFQEGLIDRFEQKIP